MRDVRWVWLAGGGLLVLGCVALVLWFLRESEPAVTGTVRLDTKPLPAGSIAWIPIEGTPGPGGGAGIISRSLLLWNPLDIRARALWVNDIRRAAAPPRRAGIRPGAVSLTSPEARGSLFRPGTHHPLPG